MKKIILSESDKKKIISEKEKAIIENFAKTFNKIKRIDENEIFSKTQNNVNEFEDEYDELSPEEKAEQEILTQKYKKRILKYVPSFNELVKKAVDGLGHPMEFKIFPSESETSEIYPIEVNGDEITISCNSFSDTYNLNDYNSYGDSWDGQLNYWFFRFYNLLKKGVESLDSGKNYYKFYIIDTEDNNRILDGFYTKHEAESEKRSSYNDIRGARVIGIKKLIEIGGKPIVVGG